MLAHPEYVNVAKREGCRIGDGRRRQDAESQLTISEIQENTGKETRQINRRDTGKSCWVLQDHRKHVCWCPCPCPVPGIELLKPL